jgi:hypothetical protein
MEYRTPEIVAEDLAESRRESFVRGFVDGAIAQAQDNQPGDHLFNLGETLVENGVSGKEWERAMADAEVLIGESNGF